MVRLAIINHDTHELFIEDVYDSEIEEYGDEEKFIRDMYNIQNFSWDYIVSSTYFGLCNKDGVDVTFG